MRKQCFYDYIIRFSYFVFAGLRGSQNNRWASHLEMNLRKMLQDYKSKL